MTTILKEGCRKILDLFYKNKQKTFHLREIARKTELNENSVSRFLSVLESEKVLINFKEGNLKMFGLSKNLKTFSYLAVFDVEKFVELPEVRKRAIYFFWNSVSEKPLFILLFGSSAKGNFTSDSDLDILVVVNKKLDFKKALGYAESQTGIKINCFQVEYSCFLEELVSKKDKLIASALATGYPVINQVKFYEEVLK